MSSSPALETQVMPTKMVGPQHYDHWLEWPAWTAYAAGAALLIAAQMARTALGIPVGSQMGVMFLVPPILTASVLGGFLPGMLATLTGLVLTGAVLVSPEPIALLDWVRIIAFLVGGILISGLCHVLRQARIRSKAEALNTAVTLASIGDAVITCDAQGRVTHMNKMAEALTGWAADEAIGKTLSTIYRTRAETWHMDATSSRSSQSLLRSRGGAEIHVEGSNAPIRTPTGTNIGSVLVFRDISERRRYELELHEQAERYQRLTEISPDAILVNRGGRIVQANNAALNLFGAKNFAELNGKTPMELFHPDYHDMIRDRIANLLRGRSVPPSEERIMRLDGKVVDVDVVASPFEDRGGYSIHVVLRDITARKVAERELRRWADAFTFCAHGIALSHPPSGTVVVCNPAFARMLGRSVDEMAGAPILSLYHQSQAAMIEKQIAIAETFGHARYEALMQHKDGSNFPAQMDLVTIRDVDGSLLYRVATMQDISDRKAAESEIQRLNSNLERKVEERTAELRAANQELDAFTYAVSHDLRAPLRAMSGFSQALIEDYGPVLEGDGRLYLDHIIQASKRMGELVEGLLVLSRTTRHEVQRGPVDITTIAERICADLAKSEPGRQVSWDIAPGMTAHGDPRMVEILFDNLLSNAWKYTSKTPAPHVRLWAEQGPRGTEFIVSDNGAGFDPAHASKLFQPFQRLHRQDEFPGIGIGLATVQRVVNRHGGSISGTGALGQGATFRFSLAPSPIAEEEVA